jgi:hypothetical protein
VCERNLPKSVAPLVRHATTCGLFAPRHRIGLRWLREPLRLKCPRSATRNAFCATGSRTGDRNEAVHQRAERFHDQAAARHDRVPTWMTSAAGSAEPSESF